MSDLENKVGSEAKTAECDNCGGHMVFDPELQKVKCPFCGKVQDIETTVEQVVELDLNDMSNHDFNWNVERKVVVCQQCGGQTNTDVNDETTYCSFCGSQHMIIRDDKDMGMKPQGVIPYVLTQDKAKEQLKHWIKKRYLAPGDLKQRYLNKNLKGIYIPFWTFDANTDTSYDCEIGTYYYTGSGDKRQRHVRWHDHSGRYHAFFDDELVCAVDHEHRNIIQKVEPFDTTKLVDYKPDYLAGYYAQKYVVMPEQAYYEAKSNMSAKIRSSIHSTLPGDTQRNYQQRVSFSDVTYKHVLLPIYMMTYEYNNKLYQVMVNGQTGEVQGQSPLSPIRVTFLVLGIIAAALVLLKIMN